MREILALAAKDLRLLLRDRMALVFGLIFPILFATFFGLVYSGQGRVSAISVAIVDRDGTRNSAKFAQRLDSLNEVSLRPVESFEAGVELLRRGRSRVLIRLPKGFGEKIVTPFRSEPPQIELYYGPGGGFYAAMVEGLVTKTAVEVYQESFRNIDLLKTSVSSAMDTVRAAEEMPVRVRRALIGLLGWTDSLITQTQGTGDSANGNYFQGMEPVRVLTKEVHFRREGPPNSFAVTFPQGILWGIMGIVAGFAVEFVSERREGTLARLRALPLNNAQILAGKAFACLIATAVISAGLLTLGRLVFGVSPIRPPHAALAVASTSICFTGIMMLFAVIPRTEQAAAGLAWGTILPMAMLGGGMIPLFVMPSWLRAASVFSPVRWAILALEGAIWRNFSLAEMALPCAVLVIVGMLAFSLGTRAMRWTES